MHHYKITIKPFDTSADARIKILEGHDAGDFYILDTDMSKDQIEADLRHTAHHVEVVGISKEEFESLSREKLGFYAPKPE